MAKSSDLIIIDTNVLLRHFLQDDEVQSTQADTLIEAAETGDIKLMISPWVFAELIWVLRSVYGKQKTDIVKIINQILASPGVVLIGKRLTLEAFRWYAETNVDFDDAIIAIVAKTKGIKNFFSFDRHFDKFSWLKRWQSEDISARQRRFRRSQDRHRLPN
jgi:predicted nucleic-acid-binding protein